MVLENRPSSFSVLNVQCNARCTNKAESKLVSCPSVNGQVVIDLLSPELVKGGGTWVVPRECNSRPKMDEGFLCFL